MKIYDLVKKVLVENKQARNSDKELIWEVFSATTARYLVNHVISRDEFMSMPSFESITRARRKVQENHPELQSDKQILLMRKAKESYGGNFVYHENV